jgi:TPR repeat protein
LTLAWAASTLCSAQVEAPAWSRVQKSLVVVGYTEPGGTFVEWGTGFCIASDASSSQFLTDAHVVAKPSSAQPLQFVVLFPSSQAAASATLVRSSADVDLAIVSVPVGNTPALRVSPTMPQETERIAVGGYPYVEGRFGGLMGKAQQLGQAPDLHPSVHLGDVSDIHGTFIEFDGTVDHGNSGGPLFDPTSGVVYGVVEGYVPGAPVDPSGSQAVSSAYANLAMSRQTVADFLNGSGNPNGENTATAGTAIVKTSAGAQPFEIAAANGDAESENTLGLMYRDGTNGLQRDYAKAVRYFRLAAGQGDTNGASNLAVAYLFGHGVPKDVAQALHYFQLAAAKGNTSAQAGLGFMYEFGDGVAVDTAQALQYYQRSANGGNGYGQAGLGWLYETGTGVTSDYSTALQYFERSANQGNAFGENDAGTLYEFGWGVPKNYETAVRYFQLSAQQDNSFGESNLATMFLYGRGVGQDYTVALHYYTLSADDDNPYGEAGLGYLYENGKGVKVDFARALQLFRKSAAHNNSFGEYGLGYAYATGNGVERDLTEALRYYHLSADKGNPFAEDALGYMYEHGYGVQQDYAQALHWYQLAAGHGYESATADVQRLQTKSTPVPK